MKPKNEQIHQIQSPAGRVLMEASIQKHEPTLERHVTYIQFFLLHSSLESGLIK